MDVSQGSRFQQLCLNDVGDCLADPAKLCAGLLFHALDELLQSLYVIGDACATVIDAEIEMDEVPLGLTKSAFDASGPHLSSDRCWLERSARHRSLPISIFRLRRLLGKSRLLLRIRGVRFAGTHLVVRLLPPRLLLITDKYANKLASCNPASDVSSKAMRNCQGLSHGDC